MARTITCQVKLQRGNISLDFNENSYEGNPLLCGTPLHNNCSEKESPSQRMSNDEREDDGFIDVDVFYASFGAGGFTSLKIALTLATAFW